MNTFEVADYCEHICNHEFFGKRVKPIIAGGFLRDSLLNKPVKDIDCFVNDTYKREFGKDIEWQAENDYKDSPIGITNVATVKLPDIEYPINLILTSGYDSLVGLLKRFNFGICMVSYCPYGGLYLGKEFLRDVKNKTLTCYQSRGDTEELNGRCQEHYERLLKKYPDYKMIDTYGLGLYNPDEIWE